MLKETIRALETGAFAEFGLIAFVVAFVLVVLYALTLSKHDREHAKHIPLDDDPAELTPSNGTAS